MLAAAPCFVMDPPDLVRERGHKPAQQRLARELGLATPRTLMTNDPAEAREFIASCPDGAIAKMLSAFAIRDADGEEQVVFTTSLRDDHLAKLDGLRLAPMVFQEQIRKRMELRITVVGSRMFTAAVDSQKVAGAEVDWRERGVTLLPSWTPYELPADVARALERYMERIGMQYSAIDMLVDPDGRHVFLEANPAGECFWLEYYSPRFPLAAAIADVLVGAPERGGPSARDPAMTPAGDTPRTACGSASPAASGPCRWPGAAGRRSPHCGSPPWRSPPSCRSRSPGSARSSSTPSSPVPPPRPSRGSSARCS
ncbi:hypothetical protein [Nannocystis pusilla]|uniref:hypothetical protein n=1 Tax=Nannocystis pusilla TaxID=889268 RepID=UPI003B7DFAAA